MLTSNRSFWLVVALVSGYLLYVLSPVLAPFLAAAALAYLGDPLVDWMELRRVPRTLGVVLVFVFASVLLVAGFVVLAPAVKNQIGVAIDSAPGIMLWLNTRLIPWVNHTFRLSLSASDLNIRKLLAEHWQDTSTVLTAMLASIGNSSRALFSWGVNLLLVPVVAFYLLRDWDKLVAYVADLIPRRQIGLVSHLAQQSNEVLSAFVRGQLLVMIALGLIYSVGLWIAGLEVALLVGMLAGVASIVPYLGFIVGFTAATIAAIMQFHGIDALLPVLIVFAIGQALEGMVLTPLLVGDRIGLHPVTVIFAIMAGGQLFGFVGVLLALPAAAVLAVVMRHFSGRYRDSRFYAAPPTAAVNSKPPHKAGK